MQIIILPFKGVDGVEFGMLRGKVREVVGGKVLSFKRTSIDSFPCDYVEGTGVFFYYDSEGRLEAVEFASPAQPAVMGVELLGISFDKAYSSLNALDSRVVKEVDGAIAYQLGVGIYAPLAKSDPAAPVESVIAFRQGYYD